MPVRLTSQNGRQMVMQNLLREGDGVYKKLANLVYWFHLLWIAVMVVGGAFQFFYTTFQRIYFAMVAMMAISQILWMGCALTALESALRAKDDPNYIQGGSFICSCVKRWFGVNIPPSVITISLLAIMVISLTVFLQ